MTLLPRLELFRAKNWNYGEELFTLWPAWEDRSTQEQFSHHCAKCKDIYCSCVLGLSDDELGGSIPPSWHILSEFDSTSFPGQPKVCQLQIHDLLSWRSRQLKTLSAYQEVLWLDVSVHEVLAMNVLDCLECLLHDVSHFTVCVALILAGLFFHLLEEVPVAIVKHQIHIVVFLSEFYYLDQIRMVIQLLQGLHFGHLSSLFKGHILSHLLNGNKVLILLIYRFEDDTECTLAQLCHNLVLVHLW